MMMLNNKHSFIIIVMLMLFLFGCTVQSPATEKSNSDAIAKETPSKSETSSKVNEITVAVIPDYPPFSFSDQGLPKGICIDILKEASKRTQIKLSFQMLPFNRALESVKSGDTDAMTPIYKTAERQPILDFVGESMVPDSNSFFVRSDSTIIYDGNFENISSHTVGTVFNNSYGKYFDEAVTQGTLKVEGTSNIDGIINKLIGKRQDIIIGGTYPILYTSKKLNASSKIKVLNPAVSNEFITMSFSKKGDYKEIIDAFDATFKEMKADGTITKILAQYK